MGPTESTRSSARHLRFLLLFALGYVVLHSLYFCVPTPILVDHVYHYGIVKVAAALIGWLAPGEAVNAAGHRLWSARASLEIVRGCDGSGVLFLLTAAVLAQAAPLKKKLLGVLGALALVYLLNQLRVVGLYFVASYREAWFVPLHAYFIPILMILLSVLYFAGWTARAVRKP
jgi:exosortase family protein XrtM